MIDPYKKICPIKQKLTAKKLNGHDCKQKNNIDNEIERKKSGICRKK